MTDPEIVVAGSTPKADPADLRLVIAGGDFAGWEDIEVSLRAEAFPNSFSIGASLPPGTSIPVNPGDPCTVILGNDQVLDGYVDHVEDGGTATGHRIDIAGRGKTQDLVDCSAEWPSHQLVNGNALTIANDLALPYGIAVALAEGASPGDTVPTWPLNYGETAADIIQRVARNAKLLAYEDSHGRLVLSNVGTLCAPSGAAYGENVQMWSWSRSMDQRFSDYVCCGSAVDGMQELDGGTFYDTERDTGVPRHRLTHLILDQGAQQPHQFTIDRAKWECARRAGRSQIATFTLDSWRDSAGRLWRPNTLIPVALPGILSNLVISEVHFRRSNETGTTAQIVAMPSQAFTPEPITLISQSFADLKGPGQ